MFASSPPSRYKVKWFLPDLELRIFFEPISCMWIWIICYWSKSSIIQWCLRTTSQCWNTFKARSTKAKHLWHQNDKQWGTSSREIPSWKSDSNGDRIPPLSRILFLVVNLWQWWELQISRHELFHFYWNLKINR